MSERNAIDKLSAKPTFAGVIGWIVLTAIVIVSSMLYQGWALAQLWEWFIVTTFGLPMISLPAAIGLMLTVSFLTKSFELDHQKKPYGEMLKATALGAIAKPTITLLAGWVIRLYL
jgi:flagellar motor component MotA